MKTFPGLARGTGGLSTQARVVYLVLVLVVALFAGGCSKSKAPATPTPPASTPSAQQADTNQAEASQVPVNTPAAPPEMPAPPNVTTNAAANAAPDLGELNRDLLRWILRNRRRPASFEDFSATAGVVIPPPPAGKKYVIAKDMHIQLVDR